MDIDVKKLHPLEVKLLRHVPSGKHFSHEDIIKELGYKMGQCNQAFSWLEAKDLVKEVSRRKRIIYELTEYGMKMEKDGLPAERIFSYLKENGAHTLPEIAAALSLEQSDVGSAFGTLSSGKAVKLNDERKAECVSDDVPPLVQDQRKLLEKSKKDGFIDEESLSAGEKKTMSMMAKKRGALSSPFKLVEKEEIEYEMLPSSDAVRKALEDANITGEELGIVTPEMLQSGSWKGGIFRPYGVDAPTSRLIPGRTNAYGEYLSWVKDKLTSLGFEEFDGPLVENEFWNGDALFMPQFHSARDIHDVYYVKEPRHVKYIDEPWLSQVAKTHEDGWTTGSRGWGYAFDHEFTKRQVLRSQGTVLSAHQLTKAKIPGKYFGIVRCFRYDQVDATHGADFYQTEGIVLGEDVNLRNLLGLLKMFAEEIAGAEEVKYVPGYFPFTEPSIEVHIKHPRLGWFELGGSGIFRPEVTKSLGIDVPVLAWGLGIDRMALMHLGLDDIRELFTPDIEAVRMRRGN